MEIDKSWMHETTRCSDRYEKGVEEFLRMAGTCLEVGDLTRCPCRDCSNRYHVMESRLNSEDMDCTEEEIVLQALGGPRSGHVRGMGCGVIPPRTRSSFASQSNNHDKCTQETEKKMNEVIAKMTAEREASEEKIRAEMVAERQALEVRMREEMREEMQAMLLRQFGGHGGSSHGSQSSMGKI